MLLLGKKRLEAAPAGEKDIPAEKASGPVKEVVKSN